MSCTVRECNELTGSAHASGVYENEQAALEAAVERSKRARSFMRFEIWTGRPRFLGEHTGREVRGVL